MSDEIDRIRHKTGIDHLEDQQRKRLFQKFVEHGGQVLEEKKASKGVIFRSPSRKEEEKKIAEKSPEKETTDTTQAESKAFGSAPRRMQSGKKLSKKRVRASDLIRIYLRGLLLKLYTLSGRRLSDNFIHFMKRQVKESLLNLDAGTTSFLKGETSIRKEILRLSVAENSTFYEFLFRISTFYEEKEFESILGLIAQRVVPGRAHLELFKRFFKRLYILGQHTDLCKLYIDKAIEIKLVKKLMDPVIAASLNVQWKKDIHIILGDLLLKFHVLICRMDRRYYPLYTQELDDFLAMTEQDKIGYITQEERKKRQEELKRQKEYIKTSQRIAERKAEEEVKVPKHVERGFPLLEIVLEKHEQSLLSGNQNPVALLDPADKMYRSILLFDDFDDQYSFILTTSKIAFNIDYKDKKKIDIKDDLNKTYLLMSEAREDVKEYMSIISEIKKTNENLRYTINERELAVDSLEKRRSVVSRQARRKIAVVMKEVEAVLSVIISDFNASKRLLQNPETVLYFDRNIDGEKRLHGKKTVEAIIEAFLFASSFAFLLNFGQLGGSGLYIEQKQQENPSSS
jgi:hypothetical protein